MSVSITSFYDQLAGDYHLIHADWQQTVRQQGEILAALIRAEEVSPAQTLLDCTCGIGTQALGLALQGYTVHATDLSPDSVDRARQEAENLSITMTCGVADLLTLDQQVAGEFDVVLTAGNSLSHLLTETDLQTAVGNIAQKTRPGGLVLVSIRDYDHLARERPRATPPQVIDLPDGRRVSFQVWDWEADGSAYDLNLFTLRQAGDDWVTNCGVTRLRAWQRAEIDAALSQAGLTGVRWQLPDETGYPYPVGTAHKPV
jgi:glycine/sarcosine N-methyltransferase